MFLTCLGITIPDITAVIDSGKEKVMRFVNVLLYCAACSNIIKGLTSDDRYPGSLRRLYLAQMLSNVGVELVEFKKGSAFTYLPNIVMTSSSVVLVLNTLELLVTDF